MDGISILREITNERTENERQIVFRHPWVNLFYNWIIALMIVALTVSFVSWGVDIRTKNRAASMAATALAEYQAEQQAAEDARQQAIAEREASEEVIQQNMAKALAKLYYGADRFRDKYGYTKADFDTLGRCVTNRVESSAYPNTIYEVIDQPDQWVGYYSSNQPIEPYYSWALEFIREWRSETVKPVGTDYLWAEYTPSGIYLKNDYNADGYARRWRDG